MSFQHSKGAALLAILALVLVVGTTTFIASKSRNAQNIERFTKNNQALNKVREALIGYALRQSPPGLLPCPDVDGDGIEDRAAFCNAQIGFVPYQTLQMPVLRDSSAQLLSYAVELNYTQEVGGTQLNSSLASALFIDGTINAAAVIISPGEALNGQTRNENNYAANRYLEGVNSNGNTTTYATSDGVVDFNDVVKPLLVSEFWTSVERRVLYDVEQALLNYRSQLNCGVYPWAANNLAPYDSLNGQNAGILPAGATLSAGAGPGCPASLTLPVWYDPHWISEIHYAVCSDGTPLCISISGDQNQNVDALIIAPGVPFATQTRPDAALSEYFEDDNNDGDLSFYYQAPRNHDSGFNDVLHAITP